MSSKRIILHIVYIHGFQGDHTTFQAYPTDLHRALQPLIAQHIELRSILYPTYKSKRPIAEAATKFLQWLEALPQGPVILCGHSMGGLLAADAATSPHHGVTKRVIALIGYDVPFLGMHPHVVVSGIASLLPHKKKEKAGHNSAGGAAELKTEKEMNDAKHVDITSANPSRSPSPNVSQISLSLRDAKTSPPSSGSLLAPPPLLPQPVFTPSSQSLPLPHSQGIISRTIDFLDSHANDRIVRFFTKHRSEPFAAATRWVIESLEFGVCMFDPTGLRDRYAALERWQGDWINFWTVTVPRDSNGREILVKKKSGLEYGDEEREAVASFERLMETASTTDLDSSPLPHLSQSRSSVELPVEPHVSGPSAKTEGKLNRDHAKVEQTMHDREKKSLAKIEHDLHKVELNMKKKRNSHTPHHFVLLPFRKPSVATHSWEQVKVHEAKDEVEAHCGLFMREINPEYDAFIRRVVEVTKRWVDKLST